MVASFVARDIPRSEFFPARPPTGPQKDGVSRRNLDTGLFLPRLEILHEDRCAGLQIGQAFQSRNIEQNPARDNSVPQILNAERAAALLGVHVGSRVAVIGLPLIEDVAESVDVTV